MDPEEELEAVEDGLGSDTKLFKTEKPEAAAAPSGVAGTALRTNVAGT